MASEGKTDPQLNKDYSVVFYTSVSTLERMKKKRTPSVIVIGAGMAGIAAARTLQDASFQVVLLESRDRIGGRVHTDYSFGFPVDLGASWLHGVCKENPLAAVIGRLGLPLYRTSGDNSVLYDHDLESYALFDKAGNQVPQELVTKVGETFEHILEEICKVRDEQVEDMSISQAFSIVFKRSPELRLEGIAHNVLQWYLCRMEGWFAADAETISAKCWDQVKLLPGGHGLMVRGYRPIINTLSKGLDIRLNHRVTKIARRYNGVKVTTEKGDTFAADAAVIALPLGVLKSGTIEFEPKLPDWKQEAINDLGVGIENKIILNFDNVFWPNVEFLGVVAETSYGCSYFLNLHKATNHPVLVYMPAGQLARDIEKMSDESAVKFAFSQLQKILPDASSPIHYLVSRWGSDINSLGSYSYDIVNKPHDLYERLRVPLDNLFFAGEATSTSYPGSVHGAYSTGLLAAEDCRMRVLERYGELEHEIEEEAPASVPLLISRIQRKLQNNIINVGVKIQNRFRVVCMGMLATRKFLQKRRKIRVSVLRQYRSDGDQGLPRDLVLGTLVRFKQLKKWNLVSEETSTRAERVLSSLSKMGSTPNVISYTALMEEEANATMLKPYFTFVEGNKFKEAEKVFETLLDEKRSPLKPDQKMYHMMIYMHKKAGNYEKARKVFASMAEKGVPQSTVTIAFETYKEVSKIYDQHMEEQEERKKLYLRSMLLHNYVISVCYLKANDLDKVMEVYEKMRFSGIKANLTILTIIMDAFGRCKDFGSALSWYKEMESCGVTPDHKAKNVLLSLASSRDELEEGKELNGFRDETTTILAGLYQSDDDVSSGEFEYEEEEDDGAGETVLYDKKQEGSSHYVTSQRGELVGL
ncbi:hypothetical protein Bca101_098258 [Brassica carinata]